MFLEDVLIQRGDTVKDLLHAYGHDADQANAVWADPKNSALASRGGPEALAPGDTLYVPIPWNLKINVFRLDTNGVTLELARNGGRGARLSWVQTVYRHNQPIGPNPAAFCVDGCTPDDDPPFYWTDAEVLRPQKQSHASVLYLAPRLVGLWRGCR